MRVEPGGAKTFWYVYRLAGGRKGRRLRYRLGAYPNLSPEGARALEVFVAAGVNHLLAWDNARTPPVGLLGRT